MSTIGSMLCDSSATWAIMPAPVALRALLEEQQAIFCRMDRLPCEATQLADLVLCPSEKAYWTSLRAIEKRRQEWLLGRCVAKEAVRRLLERHRGLTSDLVAIEIIPDGHGRPQVQIAGSAGRPPAISIAHSQGTAVALAVQDPDAWAGVDLEGLDRRREDYESIAFSPDESSLLAALPWDVSEEWALRMWASKEALGKALGRGLSAGLQAFHITRLEAASGQVELELRDGALQQFPGFAGKRWSIYTARESNFIFSAMIYQQGAVRMSASRQEILDYLLQKMGELTQDWDYPDPVRPESLLFTELGFESLDAVVLCTAIQEHYQTPMPFAELLAEIGQQQRDLSINELADFVDTHLGGPAGNATGRVQ